MATPPEREFLDQVHRRVVRIGPREHIAVARLLGSRAAWSKRELRAALASLLATNAEQWSGVGHIFDDTLGGGGHGAGRSTAGPGPAPPAAEPAKVRLEPPTGRERVVARVRAWIAGRLEELRNLPRAWWLAAIPAALAIAILVLYRIFPGPVPPPPPPPAVTSATIPAPATVSTYKLHQIEPARTGVPVRTARPRLLDPERERSALLFWSAASALLALLGARLLRVPRAAVAAARAQAKARVERTEAERARLDRERAAAGRALRIQYHVERTPALSRQAILDSAELLGRIFRVAASDDLDADETLRRTVAAAGRFTPALASRRDRQDVLVLVDLEGPRDHPWLGGFERVIDEWKRLGVRVRRFDYQESPSQVVDPETRRAWKLSDLARYTEGLPLIVFSRRLSVPLPSMSRPTASDVSWLDACDAWPLRAWIDPYPRPTPELEKLRRREVHDLQRRGLRRHPLTDRGVLGLARWLADAGESPPDVPWEPLPPVPGRDDRSPFGVALRRWAFAGSLVPDPTWDQLEAIRVHFPELRHHLPERRYLQVLLEWVRQETKHDPESDDGHGLNIPEDVQDRWLCQQRTLEANVDGERGFEHRVRRLLDDQLASTRPEAGELDQQWWEFKRAMHQVILDPVRARERLGWVFDSAIAHEASRWIAAELRRQAKGFGPAFARADRDAFSAKLAVDESSVAPRDLWWGHWRAWAIGALTGAALLGGHVLGGRYGGHERVAGWVAPPAPEAVGSLPATRAVLETGRTDKGQVRLVRIPGGRFEMGSPAGEPGRYDDEGPLRPVEVKSFWLGQYEVTNKEYARFLKANPDVPKPEYWDDPSYNGARQPVVGVSWEDARRFAAWAGGRLPTEAEWEYAARAQTSAPYLIGASERDLDKMGWYTGNSKGPQRVGRKRANAWGLHDVLGNVWEWVEDSWHDSYKGAPSDGSPRVEKKGGVLRVLRGGSWYYDPQNARVAIRIGFGPSNRDDDVGFRLARSLPSGN